MGIVILAILVFSVSIPVAFAEESDVEPNKATRDGLRKIEICFESNLDPASVSGQIFVIEKSTIRGLTITNTSLADGQSDCLFVKFNVAVEPLEIELVYNGKKGILLDADKKEIQGFKIIKQSTQISKNDKFTIVFPYPAIPADPPRPLFQPNSKISYNEINNQSNLSWDFSTLGDDKCLLNASISYRNSQVFDSTTVVNKNIRNVIPENFSTISTDPTKIDTQIHKKTIAERISCVDSLMIDWNTMINSPLNNLGYDAIFLEIKFHQESSNYPHKQNTLDTIQIYYAPELSLPSYKMGKVCSSGNLGSILIIIENGIFIADTQTCQTPYNELDSQQWYSFGKKIIDDENPDYDEFYPGFSTTTGFHDKTFQQLFEIEHPIVKPIKAEIISMGHFIIKFEGSILGVSIDETGWVYSTPENDFNIQSVNHREDTELQLLINNTKVNSGKIEIIYDATKGYLLDTNGNKILGFKIIIDLDTEKYEIIYPYTVLLPITVPISADLFDPNELRISFNGTLTTTLTIDGTYLQGLSIFEGENLRMDDPIVEGEFVIVWFNKSIVEDSFSLIYDESGNLTDENGQKILGFMVIKDGPNITIIYPYPAISVDPIDETPKKKGGSSNPPPPPTFGKDKKYKQIVTDGFCFNGNCVNVDNYHTEFPLINATVGESSNITLKAYNPNGGLPGFKWFQIILGLEEAGLPLSYGEVLATLHIHQMEIDKIELVDKQNLIGNYTAITNIVQCSEEYTTECLELSFDFTPRDQLINNIVGINVVNNPRSSSTNYLNDGVEFHGDSLNEPLLSQVSASKGGAFYPQNRGLTELTLVSYHDDLWQDSFGYLWTSDNYKSFKIISNVPAPQKEPDLMWSAMTRINSNFADMIEFEKERALLVFDSSKLK